MCKIWQIFLNYDLKENINQENLISLLKFDSFKRKAAKTEIHFLRSNQMVMTEDSYSQCCMNDDQYSGR